MTTIVTFAMGVAVGGLTGLLVRLHGERLPQSADWHKECLAEIYRYQQEKELAKDYEQDI